MQTPEPERRSAMADGSWMAWTAAGIAGIWVAVALISVFAPDMVSGSEQQHLPVAAFGSWLWGLAATGAFVWAMGKLRASDPKAQLDRAHGGDPGGLARRDDHEVSRRRWSRRDQTPPVCPSARWSRPWPRWCSPPWPASRRGCSPDPRVRLIAGRALLRGANLEEADGQPPLDQVAKTSLSNATATRRLVGS
jgi:hypothetical protein